MSKEQENETPFTNPYALPEGESIAESNSLRELFFRVSTKDYKCIDAVLFKGEKQVVLGTFWKKLCEACRALGIRDYEQYEDFKKLVNSITFTYDPRTPEQFERDLQSNVGGTHTQPNWKDAYGNVTGRVEDADTRVADAPQQSTNPPKRVKRRGLGRTDKSGDKDEKKGKSTKG